MSKAYAYIANTTPQTITGSGTVDMGNAIHGFGLTCCQKTIDVTGNNVTLRAGGYYDIDVTATISGSAPGNVTLTAYQDGAPITGATVSTAIAAADDSASASITFASTSTAPFKRNARNLLSPAII